MSRELYVDFDAETTGREARVKLRRCASGLNYRKYRLINATRVV